MYSLPGLHIPPSAVLHIFAELVLLWFYCYSLFIVFVLYYFLILLYTVITPGLRKSRGTELKGSAQTPKTREWLSWALPEKEP